MLDIALLRGLSWHPCTMVGRPKLTAAASVCEAATDLLSTWLRSLRCCVVVAFSGANDEATVSDPGETWSNGDSAAASKGSSK